MKNLSLRKPDIFFKELNSLSDKDLLQFLQDWHQQGESPEEIVAFVEYLLSLSETIDTGYNCVDCAGTGGDHAKTFNISTAAALIAAKHPDIKITKNGGRSTTSVTGSVDVLEALGFDLQKTQDEKLKELRDNNLTFFSSQISSEKLARVKQLCKKHSITSFLSLVAPLTSPVKLSAQVLGVGQARWLKPLAAAMEILIQKGLRKQALLIHSSKEGFQLDELCLCAPAQIIEIYQNNDGEIVRNEYDFTANQLGLAEHDPKELEAFEGANKHELNAQLIRDLLAAKDTSPKLETAQINAAAILYTGLGYHSTNKKQFFKSLLKLYSEAIK